MIYSSFAKQYGIRLEKEDLTVKEYHRLLTGLMDDTPLGRVVEVRSTNDPERIRNMTAVEKRIRNEWRQFRQKENNKRVHTATVTTQQLQDIFRSLAGGG